MSEAFSLGILVGSLRKESWCRKVARALIELQPPALRSAIIEIGDLPLYNEDLEQQVPAAWARFREEISRVDAFLVVTPEYNRSVPGCLKNALDVGSRPAGKNLFAGRATGVASVTPYKLGAFGANHAVRQSMVFLDMPVMQQPELYVGEIADLLDERGALKKEGTQKLFRTFMEKLATWIAVAGRGSAARSFQAFMQRRASVGEAYVNGDAQPLLEIVTREDPVTFLSPRGDTVTGAGAVAARFAKDAGAFQRGGQNRTEVLQLAASGDVAWWTGYQIAEARLDGKEAPVAMRLRVTEAFRFGADGWKLVHRHAEPAKSTSGE